MENQDGVQVRYKLQYGINKIGPNYTHEICLNNPYIISNHCQINVFGDEIELTAGDGLTYYLDKGNFHELTKGATVTLVPGAKCFRLDKLCHFKIIENTANKSLFRQVLSQDVDSELELDQFANLKITDEIGITNSGLAKNTFKQMSIKNNPVVNNKLDPLFDGLLSDTKEQKSESKYEQEEEQNLLPIPDYQEAKILNKVGTPDFDNAWTNKSLITHSQKIKGIPEQTELPNTNKAKRQTKKHPQQQEVKPKKQSTIYEYLAPQIQEEIISSPSIRSTKKRSKSIKQAQKKRSYVPLFTIGLSGIKLSPQQLEFLEYNNIDTTSGTQFQILLMENPVKLRSIKLLLGMARCAKIIDYRWLIDSMKSKNPLPLDSYRVTFSMDFNDEYSFDYRIYLDNQQRLKSVLPFDGQPFYLPEYMKYHISDEQLEELIYEMGGQFSKARESLLVCPKEQFTIEEEDAMYKKISIEQVFRCIMHYTNQYLYINE